LHEKGSVLIIVNTRKSARSLYQTIAEKKIAKVYHLSTNMCPAHRLKVLSDIKKKLERKQPVICVSTQLIEAGVDIDFGSVIRYLAGLDSIAQAAGRCNRNGKREIGDVWIVNPSEENIDRLKDIKIGIEVAERVLDEFKNNPEGFGNDRIGLKAMERYYQYYFYSRKDEMRYTISKQSLLGRDDDLFNLLSVNNLSVAEHERVTNSAPTIPFRQSFQTGSKVFNVIDSLTRGVVVPYSKGGEQIINELCGAFDIKKQYSLLKKAQRYSVNLFPYEFEKLAKAKAILEVQEGAGVFYMDNQYYSDKFGWCDEIVNDMKLLIC
jgi:CRISPR-associated endonuclease/helicase Cas3